MVNLLHRVILILLSLFSINASLAQTNKSGVIDESANSAETKIDSLLADWNRKDSPGVAVAVIKEGNVIFEKAYGMANLEYDIPVTPSTLFDIASVSKQFTAFSILLLEKEGRLQLDDDVRKYLPEVLDFGEEITLRQLASHTSGIRDQWTLLEMAGWRISDVITQEDVLELVRRQQDLNFQPGEKFLYSNTGFMLLAEVVEKVSGKPFADFARENIFQPLKMENTLILDDFRKVVKNRAYSYYPNKEGFKKGVLNIEAVGQGNVYSSVSDLALWVKNLQNPVVGDTAMVNKMNNLQVLNDGKTFGGALGQFVGEYRGLKEIQHPGRTAGFNSYISRFPDQDFAVILLSNAAEFEEDEIAHKITDIYLQEHFGDKVNSSAEHTEAVIDTSLVLSQEVVSAYIGDYELQPGVIVTIEENNGQLLGKPTGGSIMKLLPISPHEFIAEGADMKIVFPSNTSKKAEYINLINGERNYLLQRWVPFDKAEVNLEDYTGTFHSEEISVTYDLKIIDDKLFGLPESIKLKNIKFNLVKEDMFVGNSPFYQEVKFVRDQNNAITGFKVSSERVKNLFFKKME